MRPAGCDVVNGKACNGQGICRYDSTLVAPRCFCYDGFEGTGCGVATSSGAGGIAGFFFLGLFLIGGIAAGYWYWKKRQAASGDNFVTADGSVDAFYA